MKKLSFKGDKDTKVTKKPKKKVQAVKAEPEAEPEGWVMAFKTEDINGPCLMISNHNDKPALLNSIMGTDVISFKPPPHEDMPENPTLDDIEPWIASQVLVCHNLPTAKSITLYYRL
jgi:hypothetical protein